MHFDMRTRPFNSLSKQLHFLLVSLSYKPFKGQLYFVLVALLRCEPWFLYFVLVALLRCEPWFEAARWGMDAARANNLNWALKRCTKWGQEWGLHLFKNDVWMIWNNSMLQKQIKHMSEKRISLVFGVSLWQLLWCIFVPPCSRGVGSCFN